MGESPRKSQKRYRLKVPIQGYAVGFVDADSCDHAQELADIAEIDWTIKNWEIDSRKAGVELVGDEGRSG